MKILICFVVGNIIMRSHKYFITIACVIISGCDSAENGAKNKSLINSELTTDTAQAAVNQSESQAIATDFQGTTKSEISAVQKNAVRSAEDYLSASGFSRRGLIEKLSSNEGGGYSLSDATIAVNNMNIDWSENAAKSARQYLSMSDFSCSALIAKLATEAGDKYTETQAIFGAREAGAC
ncbi:Ltp family lipoprotein [Novosphingobium sp.]|uniref:Ltp family lipoprotein n=1 Tax=Novosphingobium sp. TaxID=1874826 RepID=UPI0025F67D35|nr:Ltp family lipoprotein [Novosphingobium sp.]